MIVLRVRGNLSGMFCAVLCATNVHSAMHAHNMNRCNGCLLVRFCLVITVYLCLAFGIILRYSLFVYVCFCCAITFKAVIRQL